MTTSVADPPLDALPDTTGDEGRTRRWWPAALLGLVVLTAVLGAARWTGQAPFGSDNDEYQLVARQLVHLDGPVVAGVEGSKYPAGYPGILAALDAVGLPVVDAALALNVVLVGIAAAVTAFAARHLGVAPAVAAGGLVLVSRPLWAATQSTMPDVLLTALVAGTLAIATATLSARRRALLLAGFAAVATAVKSIGVLVGLAASAAVFVAGRPGERTRPRALAVAAAPAAVAVAVLGAMTAVAGRYPEHTTGYGRTFWLVDPFDASAGEAGALDVVRRLPQRIDLVLDDAARAWLGDLVHGPGAWVATVVLLLAAAAAAGRASRSAATFVATLVLADLVFLAVWPYSSVRFGLPLVPVLGLGAAFVVGAICGAVGDRHRRLTAAVAVVAVVALAALAVPTLRREAHREGELYAGLHGARGEVAAWLDANASAPASTIVSPDYRELANGLGRSVLPLSYTADADELLREATLGTHLVVIRGLYGSREAVVARLFDAHGDRFELVHRNERFDVYRTLG